MKNPLFPFLAGMFACCHLYAQSGSDTAFLLREFQGGKSYHAVFVERNKNSSGYTRLTDMPNDTAGYYVRLTETKDSLRLAIRRFQLGALAGAWYPLMLYKGKYYLYSPCDGATTQWFRFTDSTMLDQFHDWGMMPSVLTKVTSTRTNTEVEFSNLETGKSRLTVHFIDPVRGIAVFDRATAFPGHNYALMISERKLRNFPVIANYCPYNKDSEWDFETPDYNRLLKRN
jgi:hypothetical protein